MAVHLRGGCMLNTTNRVFLGVRERTVSFTCHCCRLGMNRAAEPSQNEKQMWQRHSVFTTWTAYGKESKQMPVAESLRQMIWLVRHDSNIIRWIIVMKRDAMLCWVILMIMYRSWKRLYKSCKTLESVFSFLCRWWKCLLIVERFHINALPNCKAHTIKSFF